jgi:hypothetical protein
LHFTLKQLNLELFRLEPAYPYIERFIVMNDKNKPTEHETVPCEICLKEIPRSKAKNVEVDDYILHFCGVDCYDKWRKEKNSR